MAYSSVYVFGDSLVDAGNALRLAQFYGDLTFSDLPEGAPAASDGYFQGRFSNGYTFVDLIANKAMGLPTKPIFPYGFEYEGVPIAPWLSDPSGTTLNFAYGGAQVRQGSEVVPDLDGQTDTFRDVVEGDAPATGLYLVTIGGNDVRSLARPDEPPAAWEEAKAALDEVAQQMIHELGQLIDDGARTFMITGIPDVGLIPRYDLYPDMILDPVEQARADAATQFSQYLDGLIRTEVVPALQAMGATVTYVSMTEGLEAILPTLEALHDLPSGTLSTDLLHHQNLVFFDQVHPTAQVHALFGSYSHARLTGTPWVEILPIADNDIDFSMTGSIGVPGEVDTINIATVSGTIYRFDLLGMSSLGTAGSLADPALRLLTGGVQVAFNADDGAGFDATISFSAANSDGYAIQLSGTGALTGSYQLIGAVVGGTAMNEGNVYVVSSAATLVIEGGGGLGTDEVRTSVSYALASGSEIELLTTTNARGKGAINLTGNDLGQAIVGNAGKNVIEGRGGADVMTGGGGDDVFVLSRTAIDRPSETDRITDYSRGDIVDLSQIISIAAGTNIVSGGYVRVTSNGLIQVDLNGGGDQWATLATVNGNMAVTMRYLSGGLPTTVSVSRVSAANVNATSTMTTGAVAAAGMAVLAASDATANGESFETTRTTSAFSLDSGPQIGVHSMAWAGEEIAGGKAFLSVAPFRHSLDLPPLAAPEPALGLFSAFDPGPSGIAGLLQGTELFVHAAAAPIATVAMPSPEMIMPVAEGMESLEVGQILSDALDQPVNPIDTLLATLPSEVTTSIAPLPAVASEIWTLGPSLAPAGPDSLVVAADGIVVT